MSAITEQAVDAACAAFDFTVNPRAAMRAALEAGLNGASSGVQTPTDEPEMLVNCEWLESLATYALEAARRLPNDEHEIRDRIYDVLGVSGQQMMTSGKAEG